MHYAIGVSAPSLHRESTDSYIHVNAVRGDHNRIKHVCTQKQKEAKSNKYHTG